MTAVTNTWRQLVRRRLWPVALLLLAALAAVPFVLASEPEPPPPADPLPALSKGDELAEPVVAKVAAEDRTRRRRVLGVRKDPFRPATPKKAKKAKSTVKQPKPSSGHQKPSTTESTPSPSTGGGGGFVDPAPSTTTPAPPKPHFPAGSLLLRFGNATSDVLPGGLVRKLEPLPPDGSEEPLLVYLGLTKSKKKAKFLVDAALTPTGDGTCKPHPSSCETIELAAGETEFFDVIDSETGEPSAQYQLDLVRINK
jgi:hypothetical protein